MREANFVMETINPYDILSKALNLLKIYPTILEFTITIQSGFINENGINNLGESYLINSLHQGFDVINENGVHNLIDNVNDFYKLLKRNQYIAIISMANIDNNIVLFECRNENCMDLQRVQNLRLKSTRLIQKYAIPRYNNPERPGVKSRINKEYSELDSEINSRMTFGKNSLKKINDDIKYLE